MLTYHPDTPVEKQNLPFTCSIRTTMWMLKSVRKNIDNGRHIEAEDLHDIMVPDLVTEADGLLLGSGVGIRQLLRNRFGLLAENRSPITWEWLREHAGTRPIGIGGAVWNHWSAVRGQNGDGTIALANPAHGHMGVGQSLSREQFERLGPFAAVWIELGEGAQEEEPGAIAELEREVARLREELAAERSWGSAILADVIKPAFALLESALAAPRLNRARIEQVRDLLRDNGGKDAGP